MTVCSESMRIIIVTSDVTYVPANYTWLIDQVSNPRRLPAGARVVGAVLLKIPTAYLLKNIAGLMAVGAPYVALVLLRNLVSRELSDPRAKTLQKRGIPIIRSSSMNKPETVKACQALAPDLILNLRTRNIYKQPILDVPKIGCVNIHHGLLPDNRGTMCDFWAWVEGRPVGFSIHWMNPKIDDGDILLRKEVDVSGVKKYVEIPLRSSHQEADALLACIERIGREGRFVGIPNRTEKEHFTRNPKPSAILEFRRKGFHL